MLLNGMLLFFITLTPFTTSLVADHILDSNAVTAAVAYSGGFLLLALVWNGVWRYASSEHRLLGKHVSPGQVKGITRQYYVAPVFYSVALIAAFFSPLASLATIFLVAAFYGITATIERLVPDREKLNDADHKRDRRNGPRRRRFHISCSLSQQTAALPVADKAR